jgi:hypothetical protein
LQRPMPDAPKLLVEHIIELNCCQKTPAWRAPAACAQMRDPLARKN